MLPTNRSCRPLQVSCLYRCAALLCGYRLNIDKLLVSGIVYSYSIIVLRGCRLHINTVLISCMDAGSVFCWDHTCSCGKKKSNKAPVCARCRQGGFQLQLGLPPDNNDYCRGQLSYPMKDHMRNAYENNVRGTPAIFCVHFRYDGPY